VRGGTEAEHMRPHVAVQRVFEDWGVCPRQLREGLAAFDEDVIPHIPVVANLFRGF